MTQAKVKFGRVDFQKLVEQYAKLRTFYGVFDTIGAPTIYVRWGATPKPYGASGCCTYIPKGDTGLPYVPPATRPEITVTLGSNAEAAHVVQTILHEITHAAGWPKHDNCFYNTLREAAREAYGIDCDRMEWTRAYEYDEWQMEALEESGDLPLPTLPDGVEPPPGRKTARTLPSVFDMLRE